MNPTKAQHRKRSALTDPFVKRRFRRTFAIVGSLCIAASAIGAIVSFSRPTPGSSYYAVSLIVLPGCGGAYTIDDVFSSIKDGVYQRVENDMIMAYPEENPSTFASVKLKTNTHIFQTEVWGYTCLGIDYYDQNIRYLYELNERLAKRICIGLQTELKAPSIAVYSFNDGVDYKTRSETTLTIVSMVTLVIGTACFFTSFFVLPDSKSKLKCRWYKIG